MAEIKQLHRVNSVWTYRTFDKKGEAERYFEHLSALHNKVTIKKGVVDMSKAGYGKSHTYGLDLVIWTVRSPMNTKWDK